MSTKSPVKGAAWSRVAIFISLYAVLLESLIELVLVIYLYAVERVDSKMTPSLILSLVASFFGVPLVFLHSLAAWQYNKVPGFASQKTMLHAGCTYLLRLGIAVWLAASVAGLVVVAQHAECLPEGTDASFWKVGISCGIHRTVFIVSVVSFLTVCVLFCARELCDRPYDVSLLGVYKSQPPNRDESIFSNSSWESESTLKNDVVCLCRHPDGTPGPYCQLPGDGPACKPSIKHPRPTRPKPRLTLNTGPESEAADSPSESVQAHTPTDLYPSRTSTLITSSTASQGQGQGQASPAELPVTETPSTPKSRKDLIPKANPSRPLSADPQIRALSEPGLQRHGDAEQSSQPGYSHSPTPDLNQKPQDASASPSDTAPEPIPRNRDQSKIRRAYTSHVPLPRPPPAAPAPPPGYMPLSINHPHHPNYIPPYPFPTNQARATDRLRPQTASAASPGPGARTSRNQTNTNTSTPPNTDFRRSLTNPTPYYTNDNNNNNNRPLSRRHSNSSIHIHPPTHSQSPGQSQSQDQSQYYTLNGLTLRRPPRRSSLQHRLPPSHTATGGDSIATVAVAGGGGGAGDGEIIYPLTRRPRSSTYAAGGGYGPTRLDSIKEVTGPRGSVEEEEQEKDRGSMSGYRGADRTSFTGF